MARIITGSDATARDIVLRVVRAAPPDAGPPEGASGSAGTGVDPVLVSAVFGACRVWLQSEVRPTGTTNEAIDWVARISAQQRCAVALYLHGAQSPPRIARLLDVPTRAVCRLLLAAMDELVGSDRTVRRGNPGPPTGSATR
ncbi:hypothetical protein GCM10023340_03440 [Nocardioides marinquilinus]|uniref:RNA polymerase sigma factor 70 region 4 type 2 domain-containing protein n=1 Tax=Nocardioides marinquilinus TaxID=1210400 RepID=A0ABP9P6A5_9ACTN